MAWQRFHNRTSFPVNLCFTNAGIIYNDAASSPSPMCKNNVLTYDEFFSPGVWYDLHVFYSSDQTKIDPKNWNPGAIFNVISMPVGIVAVVAGIAAIPLTAGASGVLVAVGTGLAVGAGIAGGVSVGTSIVGAAYAGLSAPANVVGLYGANDHNYYIDGGVIGHVEGDGQNKRVVVDGVKPLTVSYLNCQSGEKFEYGGYKVP